MAHGGVEELEPTELRFVDLCAGLGGFHRALHQAQAQADGRRIHMFPKNYTFRCVLAAEVDAHLRASYVTNFPSIAKDYAQLYPPDRVRDMDGLSDLYEDGRLVRIHGDLRTLLDKGDALRTWPGSPNEFVVPEHDLLCAGFPCQPFSKSGAQKGFDDLNGTVFRMIAVIIRHRAPKFLFLENVGNFERHDGGNTWKRVRQVLADLGYDLRATTHVGSEDGGDGLLSPLHLGYPQHRERFYVLAQKIEKVGRFAAKHHPWPLIYRNVKDRDKHRKKVELAASERLKSILAESALTATPEEFAAAALNADRVACVNHWNELLARIKTHNDNIPRTGREVISLPSFPVWGYELDPWNHYPIEKNPAELISDLSALRRYRKALLRELNAAPWARTGTKPGGARTYLLSESPTNADLEKWLASWPRYASSRGEWPRWKRRFIEQSREWGLLLWRNLEKRWFRRWLNKLLKMIPSHQKLEWNCMGGDHDLWTHILQFRPSGLRVKRCSYVPALVAMTATQVPVVPCSSGYGPARGRHLLPTEGLALQGFPRNWVLPPPRSDAITALGNAVHVGLIEEIVLVWLFNKNGPYDRNGQILTQEEVATEQEAQPKSAILSLSAFFSEANLSPKPSSRKHRVGPLPEQLEVGDVK